MRSEIVVNDEIALPELHRDGGASQRRQSRPHHAARALLRIGKPDFSPIKPTPPRPGHGRMLPHRRISPHRSNVLTTSLRFSRYASVFVCDRAELYDAFAPVTNTTAKSKALRDRMALLGALRNEKGPPWVS